LSGKCEGGERGGSGVRRNLTKQTTLVGKKIQSYQKKQIRGPKYQKGPKWLNGSVGKKKREPRRLKRIDGMAPKEQKKREKKVKGQGGKESKKKNKKNERPKKNSRIKQVACFPNGKGKGVFGCAIVAKANWEKKGELWPKGWKSNNRVGGTTGGIPGFIKMCPPRQKKRL